jgi:hypothetical protein
MNRLRVAACAVAATLILSLGGAAWAGRSDNYNIAWQALVRGGAPAAGGNVTLFSGTLGQTAIGAASSEHYSMRSGFDAGLVPRVRRLYLPLISKEAVDLLPDLIVTDLTASSNQVTVTIRNASNATSVVDSFWVDVYFNPRQTPGLNKPWSTIAPAGAAWGVTKALAAGESLTLTTGGAYYSAEYSSQPPYPVGAQVVAFVDSVDYATSWGAVRESDEANNVLGPVTSTQAKGDVAPPGGAEEEPSRSGLPGREREP